MPMRRRAEAELIGMLRTILLKARARGRMGESFRLSQKPIIDAVIGNSDP
jgi:hypothetical protein